MLLAAHCQRIREHVVDIDELVVTVGAFDLDDLQDEHAKKVYVKDAIPYPSYDRYTYKSKYSPNKKNNDTIILIPSYLFGF